MSQRARKPLLDFAAEVEGRKLAMHAKRRHQVRPLPLPLPPANSTPAPSPELSVAILTALLNGLADYTTDARGDVGSWVRVACVRALAAAAALLLAAPAPLDAFLPLQVFHKAVGGVLKQGAERLDSVRVAAGGALAQLLALPERGDWGVHGRAGMEELLRCVLSARRGVGG